MTATTTTDAHDGAHGLMTTREFIAQHCLLVSDPKPPEGEVHSRYVTVGTRFTDDTPGEHGSLAIINDMTTLLDGVERWCRDTPLTDLLGFEWWDPSVEQFAHIVCDRFCGTLADRNPNGATVRICEDDLVWTSCRATI